MWTNQNSPSLIKIRLTNALKSYDFSNVYKYSLESNLVNEYCEQLLNLMIASEINCFNYSGLRFIEDMIVQGYFTPLVWLSIHYKNFGNSNVMNVIQHILIAVKQREDNVADYKKILSEDFGDVGKYVISSYL